ncbi:hypothetical protein [Pseudothermotoga sp.]|uniref:hypothetical protein n=1 Tax=Pseudothermotoga sp. TaxID=2033661 RepID=UPI0031F67CAE
MNKLFKTCVPTGKLLNQSFVTISKLPPPRSSTVMSCSKFGSTLMYVKYASSSSDKISPFKLKVLIIFSNSAGLSLKTAVPNAYTIVSAIFFFICKIVSLAVSKAFSSSEIDFKPTS